MILEQEGHKLGTPSIQTLEVNIATDGSRISVVVMYRFPGLRPAEDLKLFHFLSGVAWSTAKLLTLGGF